MSRYYTLYNSGSPKFTTLQVGATSISTTANARRVSVLTGSQQTFMAFGTSTVVATTASCALPANSALDFNFTTGTHVAFVCPGGASYVTLIDAD